MLELEGEARERGRRRAPAQPGARRLAHVVARDALVELGYTVVEAEQALARDRSRAAGRGARPRGAPERCVTLPVPCAGASGGRRGGRAVAPPAATRRLRRPGADEGAARDRARGRAWPGRRARPRPPRRAARARKDDARDDHPRGARRRHSHSRRPCARAQGRHGRDPHRARAARRPLHRRDPPGEPGDRGDPVPGARGLPARHHRRPGSRRPHADARPAAVHARRRDDAHRASHDTAPRPLRHDLPARLLRARRAGVDRPSLRPHPRRRDRRLGGGRDRGSRPRDAARREPDPAARPRRRAGAPCRRRHARHRARGARAARGRRGRARAHRSRAAFDDREQVRRRARGPLDAGRDRSERSRTRSRTSTSRSCSSSASSSGRRADVSSRRSAGSTWRVPAPSDGLF